MKPLEKDDQPPIIEGLPGEKIWKVISKALAERASLGVDVILKVEVMGKKKEVMITAQSTQASVSKELQA